MPVAVLEVERVPGRESLNNDQPAAEAAAGRRREYNVLSSCGWPSYQFLHMARLHHLPHTCGRSVNLSCPAQSLSTLGSLVLTGIVLGVCDVRVSGNITTGELRRLELENSSCARNCNGDWLQSIQLRRRKLATLAILPSCVVLK